MLPVSLRSMACETLRQPFFRAGVRSRLLWVIVIFSSADVPEIMKELQNIQKVILL